MAAQRELDKFTADAIAENANFDYLVSVSVYTDSGDRYFESLEEYYAHAEEEWVVDCANTLAVMTGQLPEDWQAELPECKFLRNHGLMDDQYRLINKEGNLVNEDYKEIDEEGFLIDKDGNRIDDKGNPIELEDFGEVEDDL